MLLRLRFCVMVRINLSPCINLVLICPFRGRLDNRGPGPEWRVSARAHLVI